MMARRQRWVRWLALLAVAVALLLPPTAPVVAAPDVDEELAVSEQVYDLLVLNLYVPPDTAALLTTAYNEAENALRVRMTLAPLDGEAPAQWQTFAAGVRALAARSDATLAPGDLRRRLVERMVRFVNDGHTFTLSKQAADARRTLTNGDDRVADYGYRVVMLSDGIYIAALVPGGNMAAAGGRVGDKLLALDGKAITRANYSGLIATQDEGSAHTFTVLHRGDADPVRLDVTIARYVRLPLTARLLGGHIGYIRAYSFSYRDLVEKLDAALADLHARGADSLILDLRDNPGGLDVVAQRFLGRFLPDGTALGDDVGRVYARQSAQSSLKPRKVAQSEGHDPDTLPIVVLVNNASTSWSEMTAIALSEYRHAPVIGTKTKGLLGNDVVYPLRDGSALAVTVGIYTSARGQSLNKIGVTPDALVANPTPEEIIIERDNQLGAAIDQLGALLTPARPSVALPLAA